jgi:hypothetical protein
MSSTMVRAVRVGNTRGACLRSSVGSSKPRTGRGRSSPSVQATSRPRPAVISACRLLQRRRLPEDPAAGPAGRPASGRRPGRQSSEVGVWLRGVAPDGAAGRCPSRHPRPARSPSGRGQLALPHSRPWRSAATSCSSTRSSMGSSPTSSSTSFTASGSQRPLAKGRSSSPRTPRPRFRPCRLARSASCAAAGSASRGRPAPGQHEQRPGAAVTSDQQARPPVS